MRKWRTITVVATLLAAGLAVPVAWAVSGDDGGLPRLPRPTRERAEDTPATAAVVKLKQGAGTAAITSRGGQVLGEIPGTGYLRVRPANGDADALVGRLLDDPTVEQAAPDYARTTQRIPTDPFYPYQSGYLSTLRMYEAWDRVGNAGNQVIAVIDTGVDAAHPDLAGRVLPGYNAVTPGASAGDINGHGTFVAGIIAANADNGIGIAGIAWNAGILPVQVFTDQPGDDDIAYDSDTAEGIYWAVDHGATIINLSLGGPGFSPLLYDAVRYAVEHDVVVVAAAGNTGANLPEYPAAFPEVIAVGATDADGRLVDFSTWGDWLDIAAPGFGIVSTFPGNQYYVGDGTSFAAPIVAGVAALVRAQSPYLTATDVAARLQATARDAGPTGIDPYYGHGLLDGAHAVGAPYGADLMPYSSGPREPTDVPANAGGPLTAPSGSVSVQGTFAIEGDIDWYPYSASTAQWITVTVSPAGFDANRGQNADPVVEVFDAQLGLLAAVDQGAPGVTETVSTLVQPGTSYIKVSNYSGAADGRNYTLTVTRTGGAPLYPEQYTLPIATVSQVQAGDVTGDGLVDVVAVGWGDHPANLASNRLVVLPGTGGGMLGEPVPYPVGRIYTESVALLDIDQDGKLDAAALADGVLRLFLQQPDGTLAVSATIDPDLGSDLTARVKAADTDDDGDTDLVIGSNSDGLRILVHGTGSTFTVTSPAVTGMRSQFAVGDVTGDGRVDIVRGNSASVRVYDGADDWSPTDYEGSEIRNVTTGDATGDGLADIVGGAGRTLAVFPQAPDGSIGTPVLRDVVANPSGVVVADFDGDGRRDVVIDHAGYPTIGIHYQQADHTLAAERTVTVSKDGFAGYDERLTAADLDGDGRAEVIVGGSPLSVLRSSVPTELRELVWHATPEHRVGTPDLDVSPRVVFTTDLDPSTVTSDSVRLVDGRTGATVPASVSYDAATRTAILDPVGNLHKRKPYRLVVDGVAGLAGDFQLWPFSANFVTVSGSSPAVTDASLRGHDGTSVRATLTIPAGDLAEIIIRGAPGTTPPSSPTAGTAAYTGVDPSPLITGLTPGQTYSFAIWYRDRSGSLSSAPAKITVHGATVTMEAASGTSTITSGQTATFGTTLKSSTGTVGGRPLSLLALCRGGATTWQAVATAVTDSSGKATVSLPQTRPDCTYRWELDIDAFTGALSPTVRVTSTIVLPGGPPPRDR